MENIETATHHYGLRDRSTLKTTQVFGTKSDDTDPPEEKSLLSRIASSFRGRKNNKREKVEQSDPQTNGRTSPKSNKSGKKNKGGRKRKFKDTETEPKEEGVKQDENAKNKKKPKKNKGDKSSPPIETLYSKEKGSGDLDKEREEQKYSNDISPEEVNANISNLGTERVEITSETQVPPIADEYEEKCMKKISEILEKSREFENKIETFSDVEGSQAFYYLDENLQRNIEKLDRIDIMDNMLLKEERKNAIKYIYSVIERLEAKARENESTQPNEVIAVS